MKKSSTVLSVGILVIILIIAGLWGYLAKPKTAPSTVADQVATNPSATTTAPVAANLPELDTSTISNWNSFVAWQSQNADSQHFYSIDMRHIVGVDATSNSQPNPMYFGYIERTYGDGTIDQNPLFFIITKGKIYMADGYSGEPYPLKETNWVQRNKKISIYMYSLADSQQIDEEVSDMAQVEAGIDNISVQGTEDGSITEVDFTRGENQLHFPAESLTKYQSINVVTKPEFKDQSLADFYDQGRVLAGDVGQTGLMDIDTGYHVSYPLVLNGNKVTVLHQGNYNYYFSAGDEPTTLSYANLYCYNYAQDQIGPQKGEPVIIDPQSRAQLSDWGFQKQYQGEIYSFTGPGFSCQFHTSGVFRPEMFSIHF